MARGAAYVLLNSALVSVISIVAFAVIARLISRTEMGELAVLTLIGAAAQVFAGLGVSATATNYVASFEASGEYEKMRAVGYECLILNGLGTLALVLIVFASADPLAASLLGASSKANLVRLLIFTMGAVSINYSLSAILYGLKRFKQVSLVTAATFALRQSSVVALLLLGWGLPGVLIGWGIGDGIASIILVSYLRRTLGPVRIGFGFRRLLQFSTPLFLADVAGFAWTWFDRALLIPMVSLGELGAYNVAVTAYGVLNSVPQAFSGTLFPFFSNIQSGANADRELGKALETASRYVAFLTIPLALGLAVTARPAATLLAGASYLDAAFPLAIMAVSLAIACQVRSLSAIFVVLGKNVTSALITIGSTIIPILLGIVIIPFLGVVGASICRGISLALSLTFSTFILRRSIRFRFDMGAYRYAWVAGLVMGTAVLALEFVVYRSSLLPVYVGAGAIVFFLVIRLFHVVNYTDMSLVSGFLGPRFQFISSTLQKVLGVEKGRDDN